MQTPDSTTAIDRCRAWLDWAAAQVDLCLAEDKPACNRLLAALTDALEPPTAARIKSEAPGETSISQQMSAVVVAMQSHDRVMQQLTHVRDALRLLHAHLGDSERCTSADCWRALRETQMREFAMADERALFSRLVASEDDGWLEVAANPDETVELFIGDGRLR
jgi:hypothetical protein